MSLPKPGLEKRLEKEYREGEIEKPPEEAIKEIGEVSWGRRRWLSVSSACFAGATVVNLIQHLTLGYPIPTSTILYGILAAGTGGASRVVSKEVLVNQEKFPREELPGEEYTVDSVMELYKEKEL